MSFKNFVRSITPKPLLDWNRQRKKRGRNAQLESQKNNNEAFTVEDLVKDLKGMGIVEGDVILVHSSLSKIGYLQDGPKTLVDALIETVGPKGTILMPTSPNNVYQLNYIRNTPFFDVLNSPSKTGKITEYFRTLPEALRSLHPTEPVSAIGNNAEWFIEGHFNQETPYNANSPFYRVSEKKGKILYIGVTLSMAGTNLHTLEDAVDFKYPIYHNELFDIELIDSFGLKHKVKTKVHNPEWSKKRKCDDLIPMFEAEGVLEKVQLGEAKTLLLDAEKMLKVMIEKYEEEGITMYTPTGS
jgi:aminoglycoside 3-N-acetyltransferase